MSDKVQFPEADPHDVVYYGRDEAIERAKRRNFTDAHRLDGDVVEYVVTGMMRLSDGSIIEIPELKYIGKEFRRVAQYVAALETDNAKLRTELTLARAALKAHRVEL